MRHGVGVIGAGPGAAALHLPVLARLPERFQVVHVADGGSGRAVELAARVGATASSGDLAPLLADPAVQVVAVCSPPAEHASQVLAAVAAGARGVLVEKPLAASVAEAEAVVDACREAGVALVVGTNHHFDPSWGRAKHHLLGSRSRVHSIAVTAALPPNGRLHELVTELSAAPTAPAGRGVPDWSNPEVAASVVRQLVIGLAVHDLPLLRDLAPDLEEVVYARAVTPIGYAIGFRASGTLVQLNAVMLPGGADAQWRMSIATALDRVDVDFPPPFVHTGSATVTVREADGRRTTYAAQPDDGYLREWTALADILDGNQVVEYDEILEDARYAVRLADAAADLIRGGGR